MHAPSPSLRIGVARLKYDQTGTIHQAWVTIAIHDNRGRAIPPDFVAGTARHEIGHVLRIGDLVVEEPRQQAHVAPQQLVAGVAPALLPALEQLPVGSLALVLGNHRPLRLAGRR